MTPPNDHERDERQLDGCLEALLAASAPEADRGSVVQACVRDLEKIVSASLPKIRWRVEPFGSSVNGFCTGGSDLDVVAYDGEKPDVGLPSEFMLKKIQSVLKDPQNDLQHIEVVAGIFHARVPIIKLRYRACWTASVLDVDMSLRAPVALFNTKLLAAYANLDPRIRKLGVLVKLWAKEHGVSGAFEGNLSSYALTLMAIYSLQAMGAPNLQQVSASSWDDQSYSAGQLLCFFFYFYSVKFRWGKEVVSIRCGQGKRPESPEFKQMLPKTSFIHIEDPCELHRNLGQVLRNGPRLRRKLDEAAAKVRGCLRLQLLPGAAIRALPAEMALLNAGALAVARVPFEAPGSGYKALAYGERVSVLYRGSDDNEDEKGWLWVESSDMTEAGWVPESAAIRIQNEVFDQPRTAGESEQEEPSLPPPPPPIQSRGVDQRGAGDSEDEQEELAALPIQSPDVDQRGADEQKESAGILIQSNGSTTRIKKKKIWARLDLS